MQQVWKCRASINIRHAKSLNYIKKSYHINIYIHMYVCIYPVSHLLNREHDVCGKIHGMIFKHISQFCSLIPCDIPDILCWYLTSTAAKTCLPGAMKQLEEWMPKHHTKLVSTGNKITTERIKAHLIDYTSLQWRHNVCDGVWNHQPTDYLLHTLFRRKSKKPSKLLVTGLYEGNSPVTGEFPAQMVSNAENVSIRWRHHDYFTTGIWCPAGNDMNVSNANAPRMC